MTDLVTRLRMEKRYMPTFLAEEAADEIERLRAELEGKISQSYAAELARQVGELEAENERLRGELEQYRERLGLR